MSAPTRRRRLPHITRSHHFPPWHFLVNTVVASPWVPRRFTNRLLRWAGFDISGDKVIIRPGVWFATPDVHFKAESGVEPGCRLVSHGGIWIGERSGISYGSLLITQTHDVGGPSRRWAQPFTTAPIVIGDGVWIGAGVTILPGVTIGDGCVVAAGAVVTKDCLPHGLYFGNPARRLQDLSMEEPNPSS